MRPFLVAALLAGLVAPSVAAAPLSYVIVTDQSLAAEFAPLAAVHSGQGLAAEVHTLQEIQALYPVAADDAERVRLYLRDLHDQRGLRFVLIGGDDALVPMRRILVRGPYPAQATQLATDQYYACLDGTWNDDGDADWGEWPNSQIGEIGDGVVDVPR